MWAAPELLSLIWQKFWIITARTVITKIVRTCVTCYWYRSQTANQIMTDLQASGVTQSRQFRRARIDFSGPFMIKYRAGWWTVIIQILNLFICVLWLQEVHLEVVEDLSTKLLFNVLKRFIARKGKIIETLSDWGNVKGAEKESARLFCNVSKFRKFTSFCP